MKMVFANSLEREAWELFLEAHRKWYRNHGHELVDMVHHMAEIYEKDEMVDMIAVRLVLSPELIETENDRFYRRLFGDKEGEALVGKKLREKESGELAKVVGYENGRIDIEFENGDEEVLDKDDFEEFYEEV